MGIQDRIEQARAAEAAGRTDEALTLLSEGEDSLPVLNLRASILWRAGRLPEAQRVCQQILTLQPGNAMVLNALGLCQLAQGQRDEAIAAFQKALAITPHAMIYHNLASALQQQDRLGEAIDAYQQAIELEPNLLPSLSSLAHLHLVRGTGDPISLLKRAYEAAPDSPTGHVEMARALFLEGKSLDEADRHLQMALGADPDDASALILGGMIRLRLGRLAEAEASFRRSIELDGTQPSAYWELFHGAKATAADRPLLVRLEAIGQEPGRGIHDRRIACFALGKAYNDLGMFEEAMERYHEANALSRQIEGKTFDPAAYVAETDRILAALPGGQNPLGSGGEQMIFIVGMFRSGTTLIEHVLSSHPQVQAAGEIGFWTRKAGSCLGPAGLKERIAVSLGAEYEALVRGLSNGADRVTDKHPENHRNVGLLHHLFPKARFIFCTRHPVDNCLSLYFTYFMNSPPYGCDAEAIVTGYHEHLRFLEHWKATIPADRFLVVSYEELVADPEPHIRKLIAFTGLPWDHRCLHPEANARPVSTASRWQVRQPIYRSSTERWRNYEPYLGPFKKLLDPQITRGYGSDH